MDVYELVTFKNEALNRDGEIMEQLLAVLDPELGIDIVNLGLIYEVDLDDQGNCDILMTLTTIGCPLADVIEAEIKFALLDLDFIENVNIDVTFDPAWDVSRLSRYGRIALGIRA